MRRNACLVILCLFSLVAMARSLCAQTPPAAKSEKANFEKEIAPLITKYCVKCHGGKKPKGELALDVFKDEAEVLKSSNVWEKVAQNVRSKDMPPANRPQPTPAEAEKITRWVDAQFAGGDCKLKKDPGNVTIRRLNRTEYNNTIRDLVGIQFQPAEDFPADDVGYGFDNIGDVLSLPPLLFEKYLAAAEKIVARTFADKAARSRIMICEPSGNNKGECATKIIENLARRAYRRPVQPGEITRLVGFVQLAESNGDNFEKGIQLAMQTILTSPHFLFRVERDRKPNDVLSIHPISDFELANRLSYFLWSSMPDEELFTLAKQGNLRKNLEPQVQRMLKDPKSRALVDNFAGQWLQLRNLKNFSPDPVLFPKFDENLRTAMQKETELFFLAVMREDRSILEFIDSDFTFLNERLANHYGIAGVKGGEFQRVTLTGKERGGVLTQASVLAVTSNPTRTSPVKRGKWILENILGTPPPPPPPDAGELSEDKKIVQSASLRQRMEQHRANPSCATCHQRMDPLGFGFENFDAIGAWRERDGQFPVDSAGVLPGGQSFKGPAELKAILKSQSELVSRCLTEKMLTYALGRGLESYDKCALDQITAELPKKGHKFSALVIEIVKSDPFLMRRGKKGT